MLCDVSKDPARSAQCTKLSRAHTVREHWRACCTEFALHSSLSAQVPQVFFNREHLGNAGSCSVFSQCGELKRRLLLLAATPHDGLPAPEATLTKIDADVAFSSQPTSAQLSSLAKFGFKSVVCLSHSEEMGALPVESAITASTGLQYIRCPPCTPALVSTSHVEVDLIPNIKCNPEQCTPVECAAALQVALPSANASPALPSAQSSAAYLQQLPGTGLHVQPPSEPAMHRSSTDNSPAAANLTTDDGTKSTERCSSLPVCAAPPPAAAQGGGSSAGSSSSSLYSTASSRPGADRSTAYRPHGLSGLQTARTPSPSGTASTGREADETEGGDSVGPLGVEEGLGTSALSSPGALVGRRDSWGESPAMSSVASGLTGMSGEVWSLDGLDLQGREPENEAWTAAWLRGAIAAVGKAPKPVLVHDTSGVAACAVALTRAAQQLKAGFSQVLSWARTLGHDIQEHADLSRAVQAVLDPAQEDCSKSGGSVSQQVQLVEDTEASCPGTAARTGSLPCISEQPHGKNAAARHDS